MNIYIYIYNSRNIYKNSNSNHSSNSNRNDSSDIRRPEPRVREQLIIGT